MMRHLFIVARDRVALAAPFTISLDRHLARGEQIEIVPDRRSGDGARAPQWPTGRERRRSAYAEQLDAQGYTICSRSEEHSAANGAVTTPFRAAAQSRGAAAPPPPPPPAPVEAPRSMREGRRAEIEEMRAARAEAELVREAARRAARTPRLGDRLPADEEWSPTGEDPYGEVPRRRGFFAALGTALAILLIVGASGAFFFAPQLRDYVVALSAPRRASLEASREPVESARTGARSDATAERTAPAAPAPGAPIAATPAPPVTAADSEPAREVAREPARAAAPSRETPPTREATRAREVAPRAVEPARELPPASLPPRRAESSSAGREVTASEGAARTQRLADFPGLPRVEVSRAPGQDGTTFTVRLTDQRGSPMSDAQVTLRQTSTGGYVRETPLEPISPAGSYRGAVPADPGRTGLTVRVVLGDRRVEMPIAE